MEGVRWHCSISNGLGAAPRGMNTYCGRHFEGKERQMGGEGVWLKLLVDELLLP
jgi:hypothetical protein